MGKLSCTHHNDSRLNLVDGNFHMHFTLVKQFFGGKALAVGVGKCGSNDNRLRIGREECEWFPILTASIRGFSL